MSDVTDVERSEEVLRQIDERFRRLVEVMPVAVYVCDKTGMIQHYNERAVELWGREPTLGIERPDGSSITVLPQDENRAGGVGIRASLGQRRNIRQ